MKQIWGRDTFNSKSYSILYEDTGNMKEDALRATLSDASKILFDTLLTINICTADNTHKGLGRDTALFVTETGLHLINADTDNTCICNYSVWKTFRDKTMICDLLNENNEIDETMAFKMARHLNLIFDD
eukprot:393250_1